MTRGTRYAEAWRARSVLAAFLAVAVTAAGALALAPTQAVAEAAAAQTRLHLITLTGPGLAGGARDDTRTRQGLIASQDEVLALVDAPMPVYRWTTALNGFAVALTTQQATELASDSRVALVEENAVRRLAGTAGPATRLTPNGGEGGGAGVVVGVVDTGIWPESPLFADSTELGRLPRGFRGTCSTGEDWGAGSCTNKLVAAQWFANGFGEDNLRSASSLSPRDDSGHGTQMASIAAGNAGVSVHLPGQRMGTYAGVAPQARLAAYKACWSAPDPRDDGCATADLVTAIDRATRDRVDVLNLAVTGPSSFDTVERALLGATEHGLVVVGAAGNDGHAAYAAHPSPWVLTVGAATGDPRRGRVVLPSGEYLVGAMASSRSAGPARLVVGAEAAASGAGRAAARLCSPGSLDASRTRGAIVLCQRGGVGRVEKSAAVGQADGVGMVLVNVRRSNVVSDLHSVPTVHLSRAQGRDLRAAVRAAPRARFELRPLPVRPSPARVTRRSNQGDPTATLVKPDVVAPGTSVLGAVPPSVRRTRWDFVSGTSAATAWTSGLAASLLAQRGWGQGLVRSALATSAVPVGGGASILSTGAGEPRLARAQRPGLAYLVRTDDYRAWLEGSWGEREPNTPSIVLSGDRRTASRTVTNVGRRATYFSVRTSGFRAHEVTVRPVALRLAPGESARFRVVVSGADRVEPIDDGWLVWRGATGTRTRIPVALTR